VAFAILMSWFALGRPDRQFGGKHRRHPAAGRLTWR
jgi:hypothetical protein